MEQPDDIKVTVKFSNVTGNICASDNAQIVGIMSAQHTGTVPMNTVWCKNFQHHIKSKYALDLIKLI